MFPAKSPRLILWSPVAMMIGIAGYFSLENEPPPYVGALALVILFSVYIRMRKDLWRVVPAGLLLVALGFTSAQVRAIRVATPLLTESMRFHPIEGTIDEIEPVESREKLVLSHLVIEGLPAEKTPLRVRISVRGTADNLRVGDRVKCEANLYPLPPPIMPGSYDFARHFYFRSIGGNGYALRTPVLVQNAGESSVHVWLNNLRHTIGEDMRHAMPGATGTVAAAMTVGETGPIPAEVKSSLRDSGLAHMLAIAGLHLGIVAGIIFFNARFLLTLYPTLSLRLPVKKMAALFALFSTFIYLSLAGYPIPAQRAFIMVTFLFCAILLDRRGITLRTLALAACIILLLFPEALFGASFQMSFAATLAIVSLYETGGRFLHTTNTTWRQRVLTHGIGIVATSLVATLATAPFVLYHFNRFALLGLLSNMVVVPLATFIIMPGMVLSLLLMPLGLQAIGYIPLAFGTNVMIAMADWVVSIPNASLHFPSPTDMGLVMAAAGLLWLCLTTGRQRLLGIGLSIGGLTTLVLHVPVDVLVSGDARQVIVRLDDGHYTALKGTMRSYNIQNWLRSEGEEELVPLRESGLQCEEGFCQYRHNGRSFMMVTDASDNEVLDKACAQKSDVLVAWRYLHPQRCTGPATLIGRAEFETYGPYALRLKSDQVQVERTLEVGKGQRLWQAPSDAPDAESD